MGRNILNASVILFEIGEEELPDQTMVFAATDVKVRRCHSLSELESLCEQNDRCVVVLDLDNAVITNRVLRDLKMKCPFLQIIGISNRSFHPELKESMRSYLYACVCKPVDGEELMYLVKSIIRDLGPT